MNCGGQYEKILKEAFEIGLVTEVDINTSLKRILRSRFLLGMFDHPSCPLVKFRRRHRLKKHSIS